MTRPCAMVEMDLTSQGRSRSPQGLGLALGLALRLGPQGHLRQTKGGGFAAVPISCGRRLTAAREERGGVVEPPRTDSICWGILRLHILKQDSRGESWILRDQASWPSDCFLDAFSAVRSCSGKTPAVRSKRGTVDRNSVAAAVPPPVNPLPRRGYFRDFACWVVVWGRVGEEVVCFSPSWSSLPPIGRKP